MKVGIRVFPWISNLFGGVASIHLANPGLESKDVFGVPQGSGISPILANVFLHYVVDLWIHQWRRHRAAGQIIVCRYADDLVIGCQHGTDGRELLGALTQRLAQFGLSVHESKTRLIAFGRFAAERPPGNGARRPSTFWGSRTIAGRPETGGSWSSGRRKRHA